MGNDAVLKRPVIKITSKKKNRSEAERLLELLAEDDAILVMEINLYSNAAQALKGHDECGAYQIRLAKLLARRDVTLKAMDRLVISAKLPEPHTIEGLVALRK